MHVVQTKLSTQVLSLVGGLNIAQAHRSQLVPIATLAKPLLALG
jgi:hypothetical protein